MLLAMQFASDLDVNLREDELFDEFLGSALLGGENCSDYGGKKYSVVVVNRDEDVKAVVGKYRHGWIVGKVSEEDAVKKIAEIFVQVFVNGGKREGSIRGEFMHVGAYGRVVLSFSLLNADLRDWVYDWEFHRVDEVLLAPVVQALEPIANFSIVRFCTILQSRSLLAGMELVAAIYSTQKIYHSLYMIVFMLPLDR